MNRRERFEAVMKQQPVDRVLYDLAGTGQTKVDDPALTVNIKEMLGITGEDYSQYSKYDQRILAALDIDTRRVGEMLEPKSVLTRTEGKVRYNCWGIGCEFTGLYWDITVNPLRECTMQTIKEYPWPDAATIDQRDIDACAEAAKYWYNSSDYVVVAEHPCLGVMELGCWMMGFDEYLYRMAAQPELIDAFSQRIFKYQADVIERYYNAIGKYIHVTTSGDDFGTQNNSFISKRMFDEMIKPYMRERIKLTKQLTNAYFFHHTCGSVFNLIPTLIEIGVDILNPIQPLAKDMEPKKLKDAYGDKLVFWGGVDTQQLLRLGSPEDVRDEVARIKSDMNNTGYVLAPAHTLQRDIKPENLLAIYK